VDVTPQTGAKTGMVGTPIFFQRPKIGKKLKQQITSFQAVMSKKS
jgi:hypothetical protein